MKNMALLLLRLVTGGLVAGHGAQKLFGSFGGPGPEGTAQWLGSMGMEPADKWSKAAGWAEFGGGLLTALGFLHPLGPVGIISAMAVATGKVHWGNPIWVTEGGAELPVTNSTIALALALAGPGRYSVDRLLGTRAPHRILAVALPAATFAIAAALARANGQD
jgi:putative oxidoreductase